MTTERIRGRAGVRARALFLAQNPLCIHCAAKGITRAAVEVDHVVPLHKGGSDDPSNKAACCKSCHAAKTAVDMGHAPKGADITGWPTSAAHHWNQP